MFSACQEQVSRSALQPPFGHVRLQGEDQKKLDVLADDVFVNVLSRCGQCAVLVSSLFTSSFINACYCIPLYPP